MPRILGVDLPNEKPTHISLRYIRGIGPTTSLEVCDKAKVNPQRKAKELTEEEVAGGEGRDVAAGLRCRVSQATGVAAMGSD